MVGKKGTETGERERVRLMDCLAPEEIEVTATKVRFRLRF